MEENEISPEPRIQRTKISIITKKKEKQKRSAKTEVGIPPKRQNLPQFDDEKGSSLNDVTLIHRSDRLPKDELVLKNKLNENLTKSPHFTCSYCESSFFSPVKLKMHFLIEHKVLFCKICDLLIENENEKRDHDERLHKVKICEVCQNEVGDGNMDAHYTTAHDATVCRYCDVLLLPKIHYDKHLIEKHGILESFLSKESSDDFIENIKGCTFFCKLCEKSRFREMFGHFVFHHKLNVYYLAACFLKNNVEIKLNLVGEEDEDPLKKSDNKRYPWKKDRCTVCTGIYTKDIPRSFHKVFCQGKICCHLCEKILRKGEILEKHLMKHHPIACKTCGNFNAGNSKELRLHYEETHGLFLCEFCDIAVKDKTNHLIKIHNLNFEAKQLYNSANVDDQLLSLKNELLKSDRSYKSRKQLLSSTGTKSRNEELSNVEETFEISNDDQLLNRKSEDIKFEQTCSDTLLTRTSQDIDYEVNVDGQSQVVDVEITESNRFKISKDIHLELSFNDQLLNCKPKEVSKQPLKIKQEDINGNSQSKCTVSEIKQKSILEECADTDPENNTAQSVSQYFNDNAIKENITLEKNSEMVHKSNLHGVTKYIVSMSHEQHFESKSEEFEMERKSKLFESDVDQKFNSEDMHKQNDYSECKMKHKEDCIKCESQNSDNRDTIVNQTSIEAKNSILCEIATYKQKRKLIENTENENFSNDLKVKQNRTQFQKSVIQEFMSSENLQPKRNVGINNYDKEISRSNSENVDQYGDKEMSNYNCENFKILVKNNFRSYEESSSDDSDEPLLNLKNKTHSKRQCNSLNIENKDAEFLHLNSSSVKLECDKLIKSDEEEEIQKLIDDADPNLNQLVTVNNDINSLTDSRQISELLISKTEEDNESIINDSKQLLIKIVDDFKCALCGIKMNEEVENIKDLVSHFKNRHALSFSKILELIGERPYAHKFVGTDKETLSENESPEYNSEDKYDENALTMDFNAKYVKCHFEATLLKEPAENFPCGVCGKNQMSYQTFIPHLFDFHGFLISEHVLQCGCCSFNDKNFKMENHLSHYFEKESVVKTEVFDCQKCYFGVNMEEAREHILEKHAGFLGEFSVKECGLRCRFCNMSFWEKNDVEKHELKNHLEDNKKDFLECYKCRNNFCSVETLKNHVDSTETKCQEFQDIIYECTVCSSILPSIETIREHFKDIHPKLTIVFCPAKNCKKWFSTKKYAKQHFYYVHKRNSSETTSYDCDICSRVFLNKKSFLLHTKNSHSKGYKCVICGDKFLTLDLRKHHYTTVHPGEILYECADCQKTFYSKSGLHVHSKLHNDFSSICSYCGKEFFRRDSYKEHLLIHIGPKHQCTYCPKVFTQKSNLRRHIRLHTGEKPYNCPHCPKKFSDKGACNSHITVHTRDQECYCEICGKKFSKQQKLKYHMKRHTGEGLFVCEVCQRGFTSQYDLRKHSITHDQQTQIICECGRGFSSEKYLRTHIKVVHDPQKSNQAVKKNNKSNFNCYQCLICKNIYSLRSTVMKHLRNIHKIDSKKYKKHMRQLEPEEASLFTPTVLEEQTNSSGKIEIHATIQNKHLEKVTFENIAKPEKEQVLKDNETVDTLTPKVSTVSLCAKKPRNRKHKNPSKYLGTEVDEDFI